MADISNLTGRYKPLAEGQKDLTLGSGKKTAYTQTLSNYLRYIGSLRLGDFANSPVGLQKALELLLEVKAAAESDPLSQRELEWINKTESDLRTSITQSKVERYASAYYKPIDLDKIIQDVVNDPDAASTVDVIKSCQFSEEEFDPNAEVILSAFEDKPTDIYFISSLLSKCRDDKGHVIPKLAEAVQTLSEYGVDARNCAYYLDEFSSKDSSGENTDVDYETLSKIPEFKAQGFSDVDTIRTLKFLRRDFEDKDKVKAYAFQMNAEGIKTPAILKILDSLAVFDEDSNTYNIQGDSVQDIVSLKRILVQTRDNEEKDRNNDIGKAGVSYMKMGEDTGVFKNGEFQYSFSESNKSSEEIQQDYLNMISGIEDDMLTTFTSKYKQKGGLLNSAAVRAFNFLRKVGIIHDNMMDLLNIGVTKDGQIDNNILNAVKDVKQSGAMSNDVMVILNAIEKDENGQYNPDELQTACNLTKEKISGADVVQLLPLVKGNKDLEDLVIDTSPMFSNKANLAKLIPMVCPSEGVVDSNAIDTIRVLSEYIFDQEYLNSHPEASLIITLDKMLSLAKDPDSSMISDEAAGTCSVLAQKGYNMPDIAKGLFTCQDANGHANPMLSEILWDLTVKDVDLNNTLKILNACKMKSDSSFAINEDKAKMIKFLLDSGYSYENISNLVLH